MPRCWRHLESSDPPQRPVLRLLRRSGAPNRSQPSYLGSGYRSTHLRQQAGRSAASGRSAFDLPALPGGRVEVLWSGSTGMDAGRAAMGHGWPVAACPRSRTGAREPERSEGRTMGQGLFGYFCGCRYVSRYLSPWYFLRLPITAYAPARSGFKYTVSASFQLRVLLLQRPGLASRALL